MDEKKGQKRKMRVSPITKYISMVIPANVVVVAETVIFAVVWVVILLLLLLLVIVSGLATTLLTVDVVDMLLDWTGFGVALLFIAVVVIVGTVCEVIAAAVVVFGSMLVVCGFISFIFLNPPPIFKPTDLKKYCCLKRGIYCGKWHGPWWSQKRIVLGYKLKGVIIPIPVSLCLLEKKMCYQGYGSWSWCFG